MKKILICLILLLAQCSVYAMRASQDEGLYRYLGLSDKQRSKIVKIKRSVYADRKALSIKLSAATTPEQKHSIKKKLDLLFEREDREILKTLDMEQRVRYQEFKSRVY